MKNYIFFSPLLISLYACLCTYLCISTFIRAEFTYLSIYIFTHTYLISTLVTIDQMDSAIKIIKTVHLFIDCGRIQ